GQGRRHGVRVVQDVRPTGRSRGRHGVSRFADVDRLGISGKVLAAAVDEGRAALVAYLPLGYPSVDDSVAAFRALTDGVGADVVEIGIPYSDPVLDGEVI